MNHFDPCEILGQSLGLLFQCSPHGEFYRIRTPYLYPDGDIVDLYCRFDDGAGTVTDLGETVRWLRMQTLSLRRSPKQRALIEDICLNHGVEFYKGMLMARFGTGEELAGVVTRVAQAALRVSDLWFTFRTRAIESVTDEVADFLTDRVISHSRSEKHVGRSGRVWTVDFHVRLPERSSLVYILSTGSRSAARSVAEHVLAAWYDLNFLSTGPEAMQFLSLFDDTVDVWSQEDFNLVEPLSKVVRWSQPDRLAEELQYAA